MLPLSSPRTASNGPAVALLLLAASLLSACGGGGGDTPTSSVSGVTAYTSVAVIGELLTYRLDATNLTYSYTITDSQFGLNGKTGSGTLIRNVDGTYSPVGIDNAKIKILPNGLMLGVIRENINGVMTTIPLLGTANPSTNLSQGIAIYNYRTRGCVGTSCSGSYGTFSINADGTWNSCKQGNLANGFCAGNANSGTLNSLGGGRWQVMHGTTDIGTALAFDSDGQKVLLLDLKDTRPVGFGVGMLVGASQQSANAGLIDGTWALMNRAGDWATVRLSNGVIACQAVNGNACTGSSTFTYDSPWVGFSSDSQGNPALFAGSGIYAGFGDGGYVSIGIKLD